LNSLFSELAAGNFEKAKDLLSEDLIVIGLNIGKLYLDYELKEAILLCLQQIC
jgi:hypothetical protein